MELTEQLYNRISRYVNGEMHVGEQVLFEAEMNRNEELKMEVVMYREIQALSESANEKLKTEMIVAAEKKTGEEEVREMIAQARQHWEREHETPQPVKRTALPLQKEEKRKFLFPGWMLLAAAIIIGVICISLFWFMNRKPVNAAGSNQRVDSGSAAAIKKLNPADTVASLKEKTIVKKTGPLPSEKEVKQPDTKKLFAAYFKPDAVPADREAAQQEAFDFYASKNYPAAIENFEMWKATLETRGDKGYAPNTPFYIHYYLALSYMVNGGGNKKAIQELKAALQSTGHAALKSKAGWYLALENLKAGNSTETRTLLQQLQTTTAYGQKASELLQTLNSNQ